MVTRLSRPQMPPRRAAEVLPLDIRLTEAAARGLFVLAGLLALGLALGSLARLPMFDLRELRIDGDVLRHNLSTLRAQVVPRLAGNFFSVDLGAARDAFESLPWVRHAVVRRVWPDRLVVTLEEHQPAAEWQAVDLESSGRSQEGRLVNTAGEVFDANLGDVEDERLPRLQGPEARAAEVLGMLRRLQPVFDRMEARVTTLRLSERGSWSAVLDERAEIEIGRGEPDEVVARVSRFVSTLAHTTARYGDADLRSADLRYPSGYALRLAGVSTLPAASAVRSSPP